MVTKVKTIDDKLDVKFRDHEEIIVKNTSLLTLHSETLEELWDEVEQWKALVGALTKDVVALKTVSVPASLKPTV